jgi:hypothetical protein
MPKLLSKDRKILRKDSVSRGSSGVLWGREVYLPCTGSIVSSQEVGVMLFCMLRERVGERWDSRREVKHLAGM